MNILEISAIDNRGGAAMPVWRMMQSLRRKGYNCEMIVGHKTEPDGGAEILAPTKQQLQRNHLLRAHGALYPSYKMLSHMELFKMADVVNLHNLHGFFNFLDLPKIAKAKPTIWTLHDAWAIHDYGETPEYDFFFKPEPFWYKFLKRRTINNSDIIMTVPSRWLEGLVKKHYPDKKVRIITYGIDNKIFKPMDKTKARQQLGIPMTAKVVLFVANEGEGNEHKGTVFLHQAKKELEKEGVTFISLGSTSDGTYINDPKILAKYYCAADVFALPSLAESLSIVSLEAMACGTPVVAFRIGGLPEAVGHLKEGYLARYKDQQDFISGLRLLLKNDKMCEEYGAAGVEKVAKYFTIDKMTNEFLALYNEVSR